MRFRNGLFRSIKKYKPALVEDIYIYSENDRTLYFNPNAPDWIVLKEKYKPVFELINGENSLNDIINFINTEYPDEKAILTKQFRNIFYSLNIFNTNKNTLKKKKYFKQLPNVVYLSLTDECNLHCVYCYATERIKNKNITLEKWKEYVFSIIKFADKPVFVFTGGEPLTVPYIFDLAAFIKDKGCELILLTNGTLITTDDIAHKITKIFNLVKISLDTLDEKVTNYMRGIDVSKIEKAFNLLQNKGCNVQILATVTSKTCKSATHFSEYFNNQVNFQPFYSMGRGKNKKELSITGEQYYNFLTETDKFKYLHDYYDRINTFRNNPCKRCAMAESEMSIDQNGNVYPCHLLHYKEFICGNLNEQSMKDIYLKSDKMKELRSINVDNLPQCKICNYRNICGGACRARVNISRDGIYGYDDFCVFEKKQILDALLYSYG